MKKRISWGITIALMAITATATMSLTYQYTIERTKSQIEDLSDRMKMYTKLSAIDQKVRDSYLNGLNLDETLLNDGIADGYMSGLGDKYSFYLTQKEFAQEQLLLSGQTVGIGIEVAQVAAGITVIRVLPNSPAEAAGIKKGDILCKVNGKNLTADDFNSLGILIGGDEGTDVSLTLQRGEEQRTVTATRRKMELITIESRMVENQIGLVRIYEFTNGASPLEGGTAQQFLKAVNALETQEAKGIIIDVRNNPGGSLDAVATLLDSILPVGNIVSAAGKDGKKETLYVSDAMQFSLPIAVLVNENSASASELLAAAIQDYGKGIIVGTKTYGKGTMQQLFALSDGSALNLTIAKFFPPNGNNFDGIGVLPDITAELPPELQDRFYFLTDEEDTQLGTAISALLLQISAPAPDPNPGSSSEAESTPESGVESAPESSAESQTSSEVVARAEEARQTVLL